MITMITQELKESYEGAKKRKYALALENLGESQAIVDQVFIIIVHRPKLLFLLSIFI